MFAIYETLGFKFLDFNGVRCVENLSDMIPKYGVKVCGQVVDFCYQYNKDLEGVYNA